MTSDLSRRIFATGCALGLAGVVRVAGGQPPAARVDTVRVAGEPTTRVRGDTLWCIVPGGVFPRGANRPGTTDTLVVLFGRDSAWRLVGRSREPVPGRLLPALRELRALAAEP